MPIVPQSEIQVKFSEEIFKETHEKTRRNFGEIFRWFSSFNFQGNWPQEIFTQIPPHIRTSNSTRLNQNSFTTILWELVGPSFFLNLKCNDFEKNCSIILKPCKVLRAGLKPPPPQAKSAERNEEEAVSKTTLPNPASPVFLLVLLALRCPNR